MSGEPLMWSKLGFLLTFLWLKNKYKVVDIVFLPHDALAHRVYNEADFYRTSAGGGTMFRPAYDLGLEIANIEYPASEWNRYALQFTDGFMFEQPESLVTEGVENFIRGGFNYFGYVEVDPWGFSSWMTAPGLRAVRAVAPEIAAHVGSAHAGSVEEVIAAIGQIYSKDKQQAAA
jgi:uncharacterized sporulation protein YeaH/YhbH (DUF444 family)